MAKFRALFLEEAAEHLSEIGSALLDLEKDTASAESIDVIFRMAHSIKSMAASVGYESVTELSHALEGRMEIIRRAGCVPPGDSLSVLFRGLEGLEEMVTLVSENGEAPPDRMDLIELLSEPLAATPTPPQTAPAHRASGARGSAGPEPADAAELDVELVAVMAALEAGTGAKKNS